MTVLVLFWKAHARLYPEHLGDRILALIEKALLPPAAVRALDKLSGPLFKDTHPVALISALAPSDLPAFAREIHAREAGSDEWARYKDALEAAGFDLRSLHDAPVRESEEMNSWCPVCRSQFAAEAGRCVDCRRADLIPFTK